MCTQKFLYLFSPEKNRNLHGFKEKFFVFDESKSVPKTLGEQIGNTEERLAKLKKQKERLKEKTTTARKSPSIQPSLTNNPEKNREALNNDLKDLKKKPEIAQAAYEKIVKTNIIDNDIYGMLIGTNELIQLISYCETSGTNRESNDKQLLISVYRTSSNFEDPKGMITFYCDYFKEDKNALVQISRYLNPRDLNTFIEVNEDTKHKKELFQEVFKNELNGQTVIAAVLSKKALEILLKYNKNKLETITKAALLNNNNIDEKQKDKYVKQIKGEIKKANKEERIDIVKAVKNKKYSEKLIAVLDPKTKKILEEDAEAMRNKIIRSKLASLEVNIEPTNIDKMSEEQFEAIKNFHDSVETSLAEDSKGELEKRLDKENTKLTTKFGKSKIKSIEFKFAGKEEAFALTWTGKGGKVDIDAVDKARKRKSQLSLVKEIYPNAKSVGKEMEISFEMVSEKQINFPRFYVSQDAKTGTFTLRHKKTIVGDLVEGNDKIIANIQPSQLKATIEHEKNEVTEELNVISPIETNKDDWDLPEAEKEFKITDERIAEFTDEDWENNLSNVEGYEMYDSILENKPFGIKDKNERRRVLRNIVQEGWNSTMKFEDFLVHLKDYIKKSTKKDLKGEEFFFGSGEYSEAFVEEYQNLSFELAKPYDKSNKNVVAARNAKIERLQSLSDIYVGAMRIMKGLSTAKYKPDEAETDTDKIRYQIKHVAEKTNPNTEKVEKAYYNMDLLGGEAVIGISEAAHREFKTIYAEHQKNVGPRPPLGSDSETKMIRALLRGYSLEELINKKHVKKDVTAPTEATALLVVNLPKSFTADNEGAKILLDALNKDDLGDETDLWSFRHRKKVYREGQMAAPEKAELAKRELKSNQAYRETILRKLQESFDADKEGVTEWGSFFLGTDIADLDEDITLNREIKHYDAGEARRYTSPEAMVNWIMSQQKLKGISNDGYVGDSQLFEWTNGTKVIKEKALTRHFNLLIKEGIERKRTQEDYKERAHYDFDDMTGENLLGGTLDVESQNKSLDTFLKTKYENKAALTTSWKAVPGSERVNQILAGRPFEIRNKQDQAEAMRLIIGDDREVSMEHIFETLMVNINKSYLSTFNIKIDSFETLMDQTKKMAKYAEEIREDDSLSAKEKEEALTKIGKAYTPRRVVIDFCAVLMQRTVKLGDKYITADEEYQSIKLDEKTHFLEQKLSAKQFDYYKGGYVTETEKDAASQELEAEKIIKSKHVNIEKVQEMLEAAGASKTTINEVESRILLGAFAAIENGDFKGGGVGTAIPLGENFSLVLVLSKPGSIGVGARAKLSERANAGIGINQEGVGFEFDMKLYKTDDATGQLTLAAGVGYSGNIANPLSYSHTQAMSEKVDLSLIAGAILVGGTVPGVGVGAGVSYNEARAIKANYERRRQEKGYDRIDKIKNPSEKVAAIRELEDFKQFNQGDYQLDNVDVLAIYEQYKAMDSMEALKDGENPTPLQGIGLGIGFPPFTGFAGVMIKIGSATLIKPRVGERERLAKFISQDKINKQLDAKLEKLNPDVRWVANSGDTYLDENGNHSIITDKVEQEIKFTTNVEAMQKELRDIRMDVQIVTIEGKQYYELIALDTENTNTKIFPDDNAENLEIAFSKEKNKEGKILLPMNTAGLVVVRERFHYPYRLTKDGPTSIDLIAISTIKQLQKGEINTENIREEATEIIAKKMGKHMDIIAGPNSGGVRKITKNLEGFKGAKETTLGMEQAKWNKIDTDVKEMNETFNGKSLEELNKPASRWEGEKGDALAKALYNKMQGRIKNGRPAINDTEKIIALANNKLQGLYKRKGLGEFKALNAKETGQIYTYILDKYFTNLWANKRGEKALTRAFKKHNSDIINKVLIPEFTGKIKNLGLKPNKERKYAKEMTDRLYKSAYSNFQESIEGYKAEKTETKNWKVPQEFMFYSGTTVRKSKKGILAGAPYAFQMPGGKTIGILGKPNEWKLDSNDQVESDIAKVILETVSEVPKAPSLDSFYSPISIKLANFHATRIQLGESAYRELTDFYKRPNQEKQQKILSALAKKQKKGTKLNNQEEALVEFMAFAKKVREATIQPGQTHMGLADDLFMVIAEPTIYSGAYAKCGNLSLLVHESFGLSGKGAPNMIAVSTDTRVHTKTGVSKREVTVVAGASYANTHEEKPVEDIPEEEVPRKPGKRPEKKPNRKPSKRPTREEAPGSIGSIDSPAGEETTGATRPESTGHIGGIDS